MAKGGDFLFMNRQRQFLEWQRVEKERAQTVRHKRTKQAKFAFAEDVVLYAPGKKSAAPIGRAEVDE